MMKHKVKKVTAMILAATAVSASLTAFTGCNKTPDTEQTLEVFLWDAGYGTQWCKDLLAAFEKEDWVKDKYPELQVVYDDDSNKSTYQTKIDAGERGNTVDLFMTASLGSYVGKDASGYEFFADLTENVYEQTVPGEGTTTVYDKMLPTYRDSVRYYERGQDSNMADVVPFKSYVFPWASGMNSILYNADHLEALGLEVPLTTNQFLEECETISKGKAFEYNLEENGNYAILSDSSGNYWGYLYSIWWGQYEGIDNYYNFFNGVVLDGEDGYISAEVFRQKGKLYSLTVMENALKWNNGYLYQKRTGYDYMAAQTKFLKGEGVFYANGDWFAKEMESTRQDVKDDYGYDYDIRMMRMPIVSEIVFKTDTIRTDDAYINDDGTWYIDDESEERLRAVIRAIDAGYATITQAKQALPDEDRLVGVSADDYQTVLEARAVVGALGPLHQAGVPSYAKGKEIAFDFLRFMATDKAQEIYMKATGGASLPFDYNLKQENPELYSQLFDNNKTYSIEKDRLSYIYESCYETQVLPEEQSFPLVKWGEMSAVRALGGHSIVAYFAAKSATGTAKKIYDEDILYYIGDPDKGIAGYFDTCRERAGLL